MQRIDLRRDRALAFIAGLLYGYRNVQMELKVLSLKEFSEEKHKGDKVYYLDREEGRLYECIEDRVTHVCVLKENKAKGKISVFIYKRL